MYGISLRAKGRQGNNFFVWKNTHKGGAQVFLFTHHDQNHSNMVKWTLRHAACDMLDYGSDCLVDYVRNEDGKYKSS